MTQCGGIAILATVSDAIILTGERSGKTMSISLRRDLLMSSDPSLSHPTAPRIDPAFRNGSLTAVGIVLGFSLSFAVQWANDPAPWTRIDLLAAALLLGGLTFQIRALAALLEVNSLEIPVYRRAKNHFMAGLLVTAAGVGVTILGNILDQGLALIR